MTGDRGLAPLWPPRSDGGTGATCCAPTAAGFLRKREAWVLRKREAWVLRKREAWVLRNWIAAKAAMTGWGELELE